MLTPQEMQELEFPLPSYMIGGTSELKENWIETDQLANPVSPDQRKLVAMDCEMVGGLFVIAMVAAYFNSLPYPRVYAEC